MPKAGQNPPEAARRTQRPRKRITVEDHVLIALDMITEAEREAVTRAVASWDDFRRFTIDPRGVGSTGQLRLARITPRFRLLYRETATQVHVLDLVNEGTLTALGVEPYPLPRRPRAAKGTGPS